MPIASPASRASKARIPLLSRILAKNESISGSSSITNTDKELPAALVTISKDIGKR
jgi:hypothetical protein